MIILAEQIIVGQVMVKCLHKPDHPDEIIQIWPETYLHCRDTDHRSVLVWVHGIPIAPRWRYPSSMDGHPFTLLFAALPKECRSFDIIEELPNGRERYLGLQRNRHDVYVLGY